MCTRHILGRMASFLSSAASISMIHQALLFQAHSRHVPDLSQTDCWPPHRDVTDASPPASVSTRCLSLNLLQQGLAGCGMPNGGKVALLYTDTYLRLSLCSCSFWISSCHLTLSSPQALVEFMTARRTHRHRPMFACGYRHTRPPTSSAGK